jgi:hypothetical protein
LTVTPTSISQEKAVAQLEKLSRLAPLVVVLLIPIAIVAVVDLVTGTPIEDRRLDIAMLVACAMGVQSIFVFRRLARRIREGNVSQLTGTRVVPRSVLSFAVSLAAVAGVGYLLGGWVVAITLPAVTIASGGVSVAVGYRRRRRVNADRKP